MVDRTDYPEQIKDVNLIDDAPIKELMRVVCYNQSIYDDVRLEPDEYAGLTLGVARSSVMTLVRDLYDTAAILIVDDDGKLRDASIHITQPKSYHSGCGWSRRDFL